MNILRIYHTDVRLPEQPPLSKIDGSDLPKKDQKWNRKELPPFFNKVEYDKNGTLLLTNEQEEYAREEVRRCKQGHWFMNNGVPTYITGKNYFYLQWWKLEDDIYPFYRDTDRRYFLFLEYWEKVLWCLGIIRGKKRREGASSQACSNLAYEAIFYKNSNCGIVSKSKDDSRDTFTDMVMFGYRQLPAFLKPRQISKDDTVSELVLAHKSQSDSDGGSVIKDDGAHRSKINYKAPVLNAYDRGRMSRVLLDECFAKGTKILCDGFVFRNIEEIKVGDYVIVEGGKRVKVGATCNGFDEMFLVKQPYSKDYVVNSKHRLYLDMRPSMNGMVSGIKKMTPIDYLNLKKYAKRTTFGVRSSGFEFEYSDTLIDPYLLGLWIGDGLSDSARFVVHKSKDIEIYNFLKDFADKNGFIFNESKEKNSCVIISLIDSKNRWKPNSICDSLKKLGVFNKKRIPIEYLKNSREVRLALLAGIIDTDGYSVPKNGKNIMCEIGMSRLELIEDIQKLARSLGFSVSNVKHKKTNFNTDSYSIYISGDLHEIPVLVERKKFEKIEKKFVNRRNRISVESVGIGEYYGITLCAENDDDRRLILEDFTISMNCGKLPKEVPATKLFAIISKTLVKGIKRVGFVEMPSTVNSLTKGSGGEFKAIWKHADFLKKKPTTNRLVRYFTPAYDGYEGFIDEYGISVIDEPTQEQYEYLVNKWVIRDSVTGDLISELSEDDIKLGAKHYVTIKRREGLEGEDLEEEIRMNPCDEDEMFQSAVTDCVFDSVQIMKQRKELEEKPPILRTGKFYRDLQNPNIVKFKDDENGNWQILAMPPDDKKNKYKFVDKRKTPANESDYVIGVDGYSNSQGGRKYGSKCSAFVMDRSNLTYVAMFYGRPETKELLHEQICMAAEYYGCKVWYEFTSDDYKGHFDQRGKINYLGRFPLSVIDPNKRDSTNRYYGFPITPFAMTKQLDSLIAYVAPDRETGYSYCSRIYFDKLLEQMLPFEPDNRTSYDCVVAAMITLCCALEPVETRITKTEPFIKEYFSQSIEKF